MALGRSSAGRLAALVWVCAVICLVLPASSSGAGAPFVTRAGKQLLLKGKTYRFTGLNIYNANSRGECWYAMASGPNLDDSLRAIGPGKEAFRGWFFQSLATTVASATGAPSITPCRSHALAA